VSVRSLGRREFLRLSAVSAATVAISGGRLAAGTSGSTPSVGTPRPSPSPTPVPRGELRLLTSADHWDTGVIRALEADEGLDVRVSPLWDDADAHRRIVTGEVSPDLVTADGGWITRYRSDGLVAPIDIHDLAVADELFPVALEMDLLVTGEGMLGLPWSWSPLQVVCDPARLAAVPDSWDVLVDPRNRRRVVIDTQQLDLVLCAARATGAADPLAMTDTELATATEWLTRLRPNVRRIVRSRADMVELLASGECTLGIASLGMPDLVRDADGPELVAFVPREGTVGSLEAEVALRDATNAVRIPAWLDAAGAAEVAADSFLRDGRPLFNERALSLLTNAGHGDRARRYLYDRPETVLDLVLTGPGERPDAYLAAWAAAFAEEG
jgi:spermidine/putrescine-binding protein